MRFTNALYAGTLPTNTATTATFRIFNYSFVDTAAFTCDILFQPVSYVSGGYADAPDLSKATTVISRGLSVPAIEGRENGPGDNWQDVTFDWTTPAQDGAVGYIHVKINYPGAQLSVDNDWGNVLLGFYDPATLAALTDSSANASNIPGANASGLDLSVVDVVVQDKEGNTLDKNALPQDRPFSIECTVTLDGAETAERQGAPLVFLELFVNGDAGVASKHVPYLPRGGKHRFRIDYDPTIHRNLVDLKTLTLAASTHEALQESDLDPDNHAMILTFAAKGDGNDDDDGKTGGKNGSGGCSAFAAFPLTAAMLIAAALALRARKGKE
jgi:hypothetical protein